MGFLFLSFFFFTRLEPATTWLQGHLPTALWARIIISELDLKIRAVLDMIIESCSLNLGSLWLIFYFVMTLFKIYLFLFSKVTGMF